MFGKPVMAASGDRHLEPKPSKLQLSVLRARDGPVDVDDGRPGWEECSR